MNAINQAVAMHATKVTDFHMTLLHVNDMLDHLESLEGQEMTATLNDQMNLLDITM